MLLPADAIINDLITASRQKFRLLKDVDVSEIYVHGLDNQRRDTVLSSVVANNSYLNPLVLYIWQPIKPKQLQFVKLKSAPSHYKNKPDDIGKCYTKHEMFRHWFALEVYESIHNFNKENETVSVAIGERNFEIEKSRLDKLMKQMKVILAMSSKQNPGSMYGGKIFEREITHTAALARAFDRFFFPDDFKDAAFLHQLPTFADNGVTHCPDFVVTKHEFGCPTLPILVGDFKLNVEDEAFLETIAYSVEVTSMLETTTAVLALAGTKSSFKLYLCYQNGEDNLEVVPLLEEKNNFELFFSVTFACVHFLIQEPVFGLKRVRCEDESADHEFLTSSVVKCSSGKIHKYFDNELYYIKHNFALINELRLLPDAKLSGERRFQRLDYEYLEPIPGFLIKIQHFKNVVDQLFRLHKHGFVHSDVRENNIVFTKGGAWLIDFDLTDQEDTLYPLQYNEKIPGRHKDARRNYRRQREHDIHSLIYCMEESCGPQPRELKDLLKSGKKDEALKWFEE